MIRRNGHGGKLLKIGKPLRPALKGDIQAELENEKEFSVQAERKNIMFLMKGWGVGTGLF